MVTLQPAVVRMSSCSRATGNDLERCLSGGSRHFVEVLLRRVDEESDEDGDESDECDREPSQVDEDDRESRRSEEKEGERQRAKKGEVEESLTRRELPKREVGQIDAVVALEGSFAAQAEQELERVLEASNESTQQG